MKLTDVIALAKAGYKKADIDELLTIQVDEPEQPAAPESTEPIISPEGGSDPSPEVPEGPDYEQLYKDVLGQIETLKNDLKVAQSKNIQQNVNRTEPDPLADLEDVFRSYM